MNVKIVPIDRIYPGNERTEDSMNGSGVITIPSDIVI